MPTKNLDNLKKEIGEVRLLLEGVSAYEEIPAPIIELAISKTEHLKKLLIALKDESNAPEDDVQSEEPIKSTVNESVKSEIELPKNEFKEENPESKKELTEIEVKEVEAFEEQEMEPLKALVDEVEEKEFEEEVNQESDNSPLLDNSEKPKETFSPAQKNVIGDTIGTNKKVMNDVVGNNGNHTLGKKIEASAINDLKRAIPINDRFRFQRELFENNVALFNETLTHLNTMPNFEEAKTYLITTFKWDDSREASQDFFALLGRRFVK